MRYGQYVQEGLAQTPAFRGVGMAYIQFAMREPKLFQLLFMSEQDGANDVEHILALIDQNYDAILQSVQEPYGLDRDKADRLYRHLCTQFSCRNSLRPALLHHLKRHGNNFFP